MLKCGGRVEDCVGWTSTKLRKSTYVPNYVGVKCLFRVDAVHDWPDEDGKMLE